MPSFGLRTGKRRRGRAPDVSDFIERDGFVLPPRSMRFCGQEFKDDAYYLKSARLEVQRLQRRAGLAPGGRVLDVGCGPGRLATGLLAELGDAASYTGVDVFRPAIDWCRRHLESRHPTYRFHHVDLANDRYNPTGAAVGANVRLPVDDGAFDVVNLYSVFSHMYYGDIVAYLRELRRVVAPQGRIFLTAFVEDDVPNYAINPPGYRETWSGALHCVRFEREFFVEMLAEAGLSVDAFVHGRETNGQSAFYLAPRG